MKKTILSMSMAMASLSGVAYAGNGDLGNPKVTCDSNNGRIKIESTALNIDDALIAKEAQVCFKKRNSYKKVLTDVMKTINPKDNGYKCNAEKQPTLLVLTTWEAGRPGLGSAEDDSEDPKMEIGNERTLLVRTPISCFAKVSSGLFSGIQGGVNMILSITDHQVFRMNSEKDQSQTVMIELKSITP